jgi:hypothetical protein
MKMLTDNFLNLPFGDTVAFAHTANAKNRIRFLASGLAPGFTNVRNANGNLP